MESVRLANRGEEDRFVVIEMAGSNETGYLKIFR